MYVSNKKMLHIFETPGTQNAIFTRNTSMTRT